MRTFTKEELVSELVEISNRGWIKSDRSGNHGSIGNTLEDLLGIPENNLPIPNASEWELKTQKIGTTALTTLFHIEPSPRAIKFVPQIFLANYGWKHKEAGTKYPENETSFRQTISGLCSTDRGFTIQIDESNRKILISFDSSKVSEKHNSWLETVETRIGLMELNPQPYWGFDDLANVAGTKLLNCFYVQAEVKKEESAEYYHYSTVMMLRNFDFSKFLVQIRNGNVLVDFDARTGHNHGTKFRMRQNCLPMLYGEIVKIV